MFQLSTPGTSIITVETYDMDANQVGGIKGSIVSREAVYSSCVVTVVLFGIDRYGAGMYIVTLRILPGIDRYGAVFKLSSSRSTLL